MYYDDKAVLRHKRQTMTLFAVSVRATDVYCVLFSDIEISVKTK